MQQADVSPDDIYSLVVSVESSSPFHEIYFDAHFHNTALKVHVIVNSLNIATLLFLRDFQILKLQRKLEIHGLSLQVRVQIC